LYLLKWNMSGYKREREKKIGGAYMQNLFGFFIPISLSFSLTLSLFFWLCLTLSYPLFHILYLSFFHNYSLFLFTFHLSLSPLSIPFFLPHSLIPPPLSLSHSLSLFPSPLSLSLIPFSRLDNRWNAVHTMMLWPQCYKTFGVNFTDISKF